MLNMRIVLIAHHFLKLYSSVWKCCAAIKIGKYSFNPKKYCINSQLSRKFNLIPICFNVNCAQSRDTSIEPFCTVCSQKLKLSWPCVALRDWNFLSIFPVFQGHFRVFKFGFLVYFQSYFPWAFSVEIFLTHSQSAFP